MTLVIRAIIINQGIGVYAIRVAMVYRAIMDKKYDHD